MSCARIGVSTYAESVEAHLGPIPFACEDAHALEAGFRAVGYNPANVHRLCCCHHGEISRPTVSDWIRAREAKMGLGRVLLVCWAGHGLALGGETYLLCSNAEVRENALGDPVMPNSHRSAVRIDWLLDEVDAFRGVESIVMFIDTCNSLAPSARIRDCRFHGIGVFAGSATTVARDRVPSGEGGAFAALLPALLSGRGVDTDSDGLVSLAAVVERLAIQVPRVSPAQQPSILPFGSLGALCVGIDWCKRLDRLTYGLPPHYGEHLRRLIRKNFGDGETRLRRPLQNSARPEP